MVQITWSKMIWCFTVWDGADGGRLGLGKSPHIRIWNWLQFRKGAKDRGGWLKKRWLIGRAQGSENISGYGTEMREGLRTKGVAGIVEFCRRVRAGMPWVGHLVVRRAAEKKCRHYGKHVEPGRLTAPPGDPPIPMNISVAETGLCGSLKKWWS